MKREILHIFTDNGLGDKNPSFHGIEITEYSYTAPRMGLPSLSATVKYATCLDDEWTGREYVTYNGLNFYIRHTPTSSKNNTDTRYSHEITFNCEASEILANTYFYDVVYFADKDISAAGDKPVSNSTLFTFYGNLREFCDRLNCAFRYRGIGDSILKQKTTLTTADTPVGDGFCVILDETGDYDKDTVKELSFEDQYLWDAIAQAYESFEVPFELRGKKIIWGANAKDVQHVFKYGRNNGLLSVKKPNANAKVINRITFKGSSENIPYYYPNESEYGHISLKAADNNSALTLDTLSIANMSQLLANALPNEVIRLGKVSEDEVSSFAQVTGVEYALRGNVDDNGFKSYTLHDRIKNEPTALSTPRYNFLMFRFRIVVTEKCRAEFAKIAGQTWRQDSAFTTNQNRNWDFRYSIEEFYNIGTNENVQGQVQHADNGGLDLGVLAAGSYYLTIAVEISNFDTNDKLITTFAWLDSYSFNAIPAESTEISYADENGYYWYAGDKTFKKIGRLGVTLKGEITDAMIGDGFYWAASDRVPFQTNLMPPKYTRAVVQGKTVAGLSKGEERFYNAANNTYIDPDTGDYYDFENPYIEGVPNEYIYTNDEIKPTIEGVRNAKGQLFGEIAAIAYDSDDNDSLKAETTSEDATDSLKYEHSYFYIKLHLFDDDYGFDLFKSASQSNEMTLQMRSGACNGCKFKVQTYEYTDDSGLTSVNNPVQTFGKGQSIVGGSYSQKVVNSNLQEWQQNSMTDELWICVQKDASTFGTIMPNQSHNYLPKVGDTFNIINIDLPQAYISAAEDRGEEEMLRFMADNNTERFTFDISASRIFFADNPDVLADIDEYKRIKIEYNGQEYKQYISSISIKWTNANSLPEIGIELADEISVSSSFVQNVAERAASLIANATTLGGNLGTGTGVSLSVAEKVFLNKTKEDRSKYKVSSDVAFEIGKFLAGSSGGIFGIDKTTGESYLEVDRMSVRSAAMFQKLTIANTDSVGGELITSPGGSIEISFVEPIHNASGAIEAYRCYYKAKEDDKKAPCRFAVDDLVICRDFNLSSGTYTQVGSKFYWRAVTEVDEDGSFIVLSNTDCAKGSVEPTVGDIACQLGNKTDTSRQNAIIISTTATDAPSIKLYTGIDTFSLSDKDIIAYGYDKTKGRAYFKCYGDSYVGAPDGSTFVKYDQAAKKTTIKADLEITSTVGGKNLDEYIKEVVPPVTQEDIEGYVEAITDPKFENLQNQIDGAIETWFSNGEPTLTNTPAKDWTTTALKNQHLGDLYYDNNTGTAYRFSQNDAGAYLWVVITDDAITKALAAAKNAQDTADGKRRVFYGEPTPPYDAGDLWVNATYGTQYKNDILRCTKAKTATGKFAISDWALASKYTDDSKLNDFIAGYQDTIADIEKQIDGKAETWYQSTDPSANWTTSEDKANHKGDLWYNTADNTTWYWTGAEWQQQDIPQSVFDTIDGKNSIFVSKPTSYKRNDLWFLEADYTLSGVAYKTGTLVVAIQDSDTFNASHWAKKDRYTDDTEAIKALTRLSKWAEDGLFSPSERTELVAEKKRIDSEKAQYVAQLGEYTGMVAKIDGLQAAYDTYISAHTAYATAITNVVNATPDADNCVAVPTGFEAAAQAYYNAKSALASKFVTASKYYTLTQVADYEYLKKALAQDTSISGGLIMSTLISLGTTASDGTRTTWGGMNGAYESGRTIASWWGGEMVDHEATPDAANYAQSLIRMDGSGYLAGGLLTWDNKGNVTIGAGIEIAGGTGGSHTLAQILNTLNGLNQMFMPVDKDGNELPLSQIGTAFALKAKLGLYSDSFISARGLNAEGGSSGGSAFGLMRTWSSSAPSASTTDALGANLGWELRTRIAALEGKNYLNDLNLVLSGDGNAVTTATLSANKKTLTLHKGATFLTPTNTNITNGVITIDGVSITPLTAHQSLSAYLTKTDAAATYQPKGNYLTAHQAIHALTIQRNGTTVGTYTPNSAAKTINISDVASAATLSSHTSNTTVHITSAERTKWNKVVTDFAAITGEDTDNIINKWEEVVAFLDTYTEADTLANLLSNKVDKVAGKGLSTNDFTNALLTKLNGIEAGANKYVHPSATATTISAASGKVLSAITVNALGHVTSVSSKTLAATDIPALSWDKITSGKPTTLAGYGITDGVNSVTVSGSGNAVTAASISGHTLTLTKGATYLSQATFADLFEKVNIGTSSAPVYAIRAKYGFYSDSFVSAKGFNTSGSGSGGTQYGRLDAWADYDATAGEVLSAVLGYDLHTRLSSASSSIAAMNTRLNALEGGSAMTITTTGSGNAITALSKSGTTITATKGATFLTAITKAQVESVLTGTITSHRHNSNIIPRANYGHDGVTSAWSTVGEAKEVIKNHFYNGSTGVGENVVVSTGVIAAWNDDSATPVDSSLTSFTRISGGYPGNYGTYLLASYGDNNLRYCGLVNGKWTEIRTIANTTYVDNSISSSLAAYLTKTDAAATYQPKGNYLTAHQAIHALTIQRNGTTVGTYTPNSAAKTINISDVASAATLSSHTSNTTVHITSAERTKWNKLTGTAGATNIPIWLNGGTPTAVSTIRENLVDWSNTGVAGVSYIDRVNPRIGSWNVLADINPDALTVEYSRDAGVTWVDYGLTNPQKKSFCTTSNQIAVGKRNNGEATVDDRLRVTINFGTANLYFHRGKLFANVTTNYAQNCKALIERYGSDGKWYTMVETWYLSGWPNWNSISLPWAFGENKDVSKLRITFRQEGFSSANNPLLISSINLTAGNKYTMPNTLASIGTPYRMMFGDYGYANFVYRIHVPQLISTTTSESPLRVSSTVKVDNLNADLLDGKHDTDFCFIENDNSTNITTTYTMGQTYVKRVGSQTGTPAGLYGNLLHVSGKYSDTAFELYAGYDTDNFYFRRGTTNSMKNNAWKLIAFTDSNVASATKLQTSRTLWGQSFNGTDNVSGNMTGVGNVTGTNWLINDSSTNPYLKLVHGGVNWYVQAYQNTLQFGAGSTASLKINSNGDVSIYKSLSASSTIASTYIFNRTSYTGLSWNNGYGALNVEIADNSNQTPLLLAYRSGSNESATGANRLFAMELLNSGTALRFAFGGSKWVTMGSSGSLEAESINSKGTVSGATVISSGRVNAGTIELSSPTPYIDFHFGNSTADYTSRIIEKVSGQLQVVGKLAVTSTIYAQTGIWSDGYVSAKGQNTSSDERLKSICGDIRLSLDAIANAPAVRFRWKDSGKAAVGTIAQYFDRIMPEVVSKRDDGMLTMDYGVSALVSAIVIARKVRNHEERIQYLEAENRRLKKELEKQKSA